MAKKKGLLESELENADYMTLLNGGETGGIFTKNSMIDYSYPTGVSLIDYTLGYEINIRDENDKVVGKRLCLGLQAGSFNVITGRTQSFKTTISIQIISNIAYANGGNIIHYDAENRLVLERVKLLSKLPESWFSGDTPRYSLRSGAIGFDTLQNDITQVYENKMRHKDLLIKDTGVLDSTGKPIKLMPPTVIFLDSLQDVIGEATDYNIDSKNFDDNKELRGNMYGAQSAKTIRGFLTDILPMLKEANIIFIAIAHKTSNMSLNPFAGVKKQFQYAANDERISGGSAVEFNASAVINLSGLVKDDSRFHYNTDGFEGNTVLYEPTKVSTNESGNEKTGLGFKLIVDKKKEGLDNLRTLVEFLKDRGRLKGNRAGFKVIDKEGKEISEKFTWKKIYEDFTKDKDSYRAFMIAAKEELEKLVAPAQDVAGTIKPFDVDSILNELG